MRLSSPLLSAALGPDGPVRKPAKEISPSPADLEVMRIVAILQYIVGGTTLLGSALLVGNVDAYDDRAFIVLGALAMILALYRTLKTGSMTLAHARLANIAGLVFIALIVATAKPIGATPAFYLWPILTAAYFLRRRDLYVVFAIFVATLLIAVLGFSGRGSEFMIIMPTLLVVFVVTVIVRLMRESLAAQTADLERSASTDELTTLANRSMVRRSLLREIDRSRRIGAALSLMIFDLDHFKLVNDRLGHAGGDQALRRVADLVRQECRGGDLPARYGGEEFMVLMPDTGVSEAIACAERLRRRIEAETVGDAAPLTVSVGVAMLRASDAGPDDVIEAADAALYDAKHGGRNRVELADRHEPDLVRDPA